MKLSTINNIEHPNFAADDAWMFETDALPCPMAKEMQPLTDEETINVDIATIRESSHHRCWPREAVETFLAAEVPKPLSAHSTPPRCVAEQQNRQEVR